MPSLVTAPSAPARTCKALKQVKVQSKARDLAPLNSCAYMYTSDQSPSILMFRHVRIGHYKGTHIDISKLFWWPDRYFMKTHSADPDDCGIPSGHTLLANAQVKDR